jgi:copper chaperone CopZ
LVVQEIELRVPMCCSKCEGKVKDTLRKVPGVTEIITDRRASLVTVCGKVDPQVALKAVQKTKKKADFYRKQIYSENFINFIQSKTGRAEPEEEPELTSSYHQHVASENGDSHHAYEDSENLSSYDEYPGYSERDDDDDSHEERGSAHSFVIDEDDVIERKRGYYNQLNYGHRSDFSPYGMPSSSFDRVEESYRTVDDRPRYEPPYYSHVEPSYGARERMPYYERESTSMYGDYGSSYAEPSSYRPSQSYAPSQGYGPSGISNPGYMKRVISDY